ncbi:MAG: addiction module protein [Rhodothermales bacterium]
MLTRSAKIILRDALALDESDRAAVAGLLIQSLDDVPDEGVEDAWAAEVDRRAKQIDSGEVATIPWEEVRVNW